jgi:hypothetical protein
MRDPSGTAACGPPSNSGRMAWVGTADRCRYWGWPKVNGSDLLMVSPGVLWRLLRGGRNSVGHDIDRQSEELHRK